MAIDDTGCPRPSRRSTSRSTRPATRASRWATGAGWCASGWPWCATRCVGGGRPAPTDGWLAARGGAPSGSATRSCRGSRRSARRCSRRPTSRPPRMELKRLARRRQPAHAAAQRPRLRRGRDGDRRLGVAPHGVYSARARRGAAGGVPERPIGTALKAVAGRGMSTAGSNPAPSASGVEGADPFAVSGAASLHAARRPPGPRRAARPSSRGRVPGGARP